MYTHTDHIIIFELMSLTVLNLQIQNTPVKGSKGSTQMLTPTKYQDSSSTGGEGSDKLSDEGTNNSPNPRDAAVCLVYDVQKMAQMLSTLYEHSIHPHICHLPLDKIALVKGKIVLLF